MPIPDSILVIRLSSLGDVLMSMPAVKALKEKSPQTHVSWLVEGSVSELLSCQDFIDEVILFPRSQIVRSLKEGRLAVAASVTGQFLHSLRARRYDIIADYHGIIKSVILGLCAGGGKRVGFGKTFAKEMSHLFYNETVEGNDKRIHKVERNMLISRSIGSNGSFPSLSLKVPAAAEAYIAAFFQETGLTSPVFAVNPFSSRGTSYKRWDLRNYAELINKIRVRVGARVIILWGPGEREEAEHLRQQTGEGVLLACPTTVTQLLALLKRMDMYIGGDTGVMHLAALSGRPVVAIFGPTDHRINAPYGSGHIVLRKDVECSPCKERDCGDRKCLTSISVDEVLKHVILASGGGK